VIRIQARDLPDLPGHRIRTRSRDGFEKGRRFSTSLAPGDVRSTHIARVPTPQRVAGMRKREGAGTGIAAGACSAVSAQVAIARKGGSPGPACADGPSASSHWSDTLPAVIRALRGPRVASSRAT
jgi:hypothetical protein